MNLSTALATVIVDELIANGVTDAVVCPGSRNAPLSLALSAADREGRIRLHVRVDERTAGFLALGLAKVSGRPVPVATTSGTAVANLHPAVLEAHHSGVPIMVLSADRPHRLRGVGANQVIDQMALFQGALRYQYEFAEAHLEPGQHGYWRSMVCRALAAASGYGGMQRRGPVQLNIPFDMPLLPDSSERSYDVSPGRGTPWTSMAETTKGRQCGAVAAPNPGERTLIVAALGAQGAKECAAAGYPVVAEAGGLAGAAVLSAGVHLLADSTFMAAHLPDRVIVLGRPTLFRAVTALVAREGLVIDIVDDPEAFADLAGTARHVAPSMAVPVPAQAGSVAGRYASSWRDADAQASRIVDSVLIDDQAPAGVRSPALARAVAAALPDGATLVLGSSQPPRDIGMFSESRDGVRVFANRGVAGIDGTLSTAIGCALASDRPTVALVGDLTFVHDITALAIGSAEPRPDLTIVVANNDGGAIFATLEQGAPGYAQSFERVFAAPVGADLERIVTGFGVPFTRAETLDEVTCALTCGARGIHVVECVVDRGDLRGFLRRTASVVADAIAPR